MEIWNAYDENFNLVKGVTLVRGKAIPQGLYHLVCDVVVRHKDGEYLLMKRHPAKHGGGKWQATAGGSAIFGETPLQCALRELAEETGICAKQLIYLGRTLSAGAIYCGYLCITDRKDGIVLCEGETVDYKWVGRDCLFLMTEDRLITRRFLPLADAK